jgi:DNA-binding protein H-NS
MTSNDLERMSIEELWALHVEISNVLAGKIATEKRQLERRLGMLQATSRSSPSSRRERRPYPQVFPKYRNPSKPSETWAGRGKLPRWLKAELQSGKKIDDFRINNADYRSTRRSVHDCFVESTSHGIKAEGLAYQSRGPVSSKGFLSNGCARLGSAEDDVAIRYCIG